MQVVREVWRELEAQSMFFEEQDRDPAAKSRVVGLPWVLPVEAVPRHRKHGQRLYPLEAHPVISGETSH
jgi:hypothetical protein